MIVKDEETIIEQTLQSFVEHVDYYVICDTGSRDDTMDRIRRVMGKCQVPGEIHEIEFRNFEYARNRALELARQSRADFDYIILGDADLPLQVSDPRWKQHLRADCYLARIYTPRVSYYQIRLLKRQTPALYVGVTHEKLNCEGKRERLRSIEFHEKGTGASRKVKYERDIALLEQAIKTEPDNSRYHFYLGQSYFNVKRFQDAITAYRQRVGMGGKAEEIFYSLFRIGQCHEELGDWESALKHYLEAYEFRPARIEPLYRIARHYRQHEQYHVAYVYSKRAVESGYPRDDILFVRQDIYDYKLLEEHAICSYEIGKYNESYDCCVQLLDKESLPAARRQRIRRKLETTRKKLSRSAR